MLGMRQAAVTPGMLPLRADVALAWWGTLSSLPLSLFLLKRINNYYTIYKP